MFHRKTVLMISVSALGFLSACADWNSAEVTPTTRADTPENLLAAQGSWELIEADSSGANPLDQHKSARAQVNPNDQRKKDYVAPEKVAALSTETDQDVNFRLIRMEKEVAGLRQDFDRLLPPLTNLITADAALDNTVQNITAQRVAEQAVIPATPAPAQKPEYIAMAPARELNTIAPAAGPSVPSPAPSSSGTAVQNIRLGDHPGKTRLVMDLSGASSFSPQIDNNEKILLIELPNAAWNADTQKNLSSGLISGFRAQPGPQGGTIVAFELKKPVRIIASEALPPSDGSGNRIYLDLAPL